MAEGALTDLFAAVKVLTQTVSVLVVQSDNPGLIAFWNDEWDKIMDATEAHNGR